MLLSSLLFDRVRGPLALKLATWPLASSR